MTINLYYVGFALALIGMATAPVRLVFYCLRRRRMHDMQDELDMQKYLDERRATLGEWASLFENDYPGCFGDYMRIRNCQTRFLRRQFKFSAEN